MPHNTRHDTTNDTTLALVRNDTHMRRLEQENEPDGTVEGAGTEGQAVAHVALADVAVINSSLGRHVCCRCVSCGQQVTKSSKLRG
jgi:hypothetical protein